MTDIKRYTEEDFTFEYHDLTYGPAVVVSHKDKEFPKYVLKSDEKMDKSGWGKVRHGFHLAMCRYGDPMKSSDYKGLYDTVDVHEAIESLIIDLNENEKIYAIEMEVGPLAQELSSEIDDFVSSLVPFPRRTVDGAMENIEIAFIALRARYNELKELYGER